MILLLNSVSTYYDYIQMANPVEEEQREIEVLEWDDASNSFTTAGDTSPDLDRLRRDRVIIHLLVLTQGGNPIAEGSKRSP